MNLALDGAVEGCVQGLASSRRCPWLPLTTPSLQAAVGNLRQKAAVRRRGATWSIKIKAITYSDAPDNRRELAQDTAENREQFGTANESQR
jgi:hypothetical protein